MSRYDVIDIGDRVVFRCGEERERRIKTADSHITFPFPIRPIVLTFTSAVLERPRLTLVLVEYLALLDGLLMVKCLTRID